MAETTEITRDEAMKVLLCDDELSDLTLKSKFDGTEVLAHRSILAVRSQVLRRMLFGKFAESSQSTIELPYSGDTLNALVDYLYNDQILVATKARFNQDLREKKQKKEERKEDGKDDEDTDWKKDFDLAKTVASTIEAASYFELPLFRKKCEDIAMKMMTKSRMFCVYFLVLCEGHVSLRWSDMDKYAFEHVCLYPGLLFKNETLLSAMSYKRIETFVHTKSIVATEFDLFRLIQKWADEDAANSTTSAGDKDSLVDNELSSPFDFQIHTESRSEAAKQLLNHVDLTRIDPIKFLTTVKCSGLVGEEQLHEVTEAVLMRTYQQKYMSPFLPRMLVWEDSSRTRFVSISEHGYAVSRLRCQPLTSGIFKWKILVDECCDTDGLGVASTNYQIQPHVNLGQQIGGWVALASGQTISNNTSGLTASLKFKKGSYVCFTLDLTGTGDLYASVDGKLPALKLFSNMKMSRFDEAGFVPAASMKKGGTVTFIGFSYDD